MGTGAYKINIDYWRNKVINHGKDTYKTLPGDIVILSSAKPEHVSDLQRSGWKWTFASVNKLLTDYKEKAKKASKQGDETADEPVEFIIQILKDSDLEILKLPLFVVYLTNITTNKRIWSSLHMESSAIIQQALLSSPEDGGIFNCDACSSDDQSWWEEDIDQGLIANLNDSQIKSIYSCLQKMKCRHKRSVQLIWGPPGTRKTNTLRVLLFILLQMNFRTLVCAPTNIAIKEVASRVLSLVRQSFRSEKLHQFPSLAHLIVFGNEERLKVKGEAIEEIYLDYRVERLYECFGEQKGWKNSICSMTDFLKNPILGLHLREDNKLMREKGLGSYCIQLIQERFNYAASLIKGSISIVLTHFPTISIPEQNVNDMVQVLSMLDSIDMCLQNDLVSEKVEEILLREDKLGETSADVFEISSSLLLKRSKCLLLLKNLLCAFDEQHTKCVKEVESLCFENGRLIFCTASSSYRLHSKAAAPLELLVIDEASQLKECESTIPLQLLGARHATLVGDNCQLPALVNSKVSAEAGFGRSLFERLPSIGYSKQLLNIQYRMHPSISRFPNSTFYFNKIVDAANVKSEAHQRQYILGDMFGTYSFINVAYGTVELDDVSHSRRNYIEVAIVVKLVQNLYRAWKATKEKLSIGVISPYSAQVAAIKKKLSPKFPEGFSVEVKSVDGFQGGEKDIIILSTVRSNGHCSIGFLSNFQRTNVSLTRARHCLWILGHERTLRESQSVWSSLIQDAKDRGCFFDAHQDESIKKSVLEVKKELDQLDDLLKEDSVLFSCTRWKVIFSDNFRKSFSQLRASSLRKAILNVLFKLANGWRPQRSSMDYVSETSNQIVKQFLVEGKYIICTIDIEKETKYTQVLKVWDVMALEEVPKILKRLDNIFRMYTDDYISYCKQTCFEGKLEVPMSWDTCHEIIPFKASVMDEDDSTASVDIPGAATVENSTISESLLLMKFYSLSSNTASYLLSEQSETEIDLPFEVTDEEREVIKLNRSSFILGRSGTGKTTILTMKLFQEQQLYHAVSEGLDSASSSSSSLALWPSHLAGNVKDSKKTFLRQMFVTVSPKLCRAVKKHITDLVRFTRGEVCSPETISSELDCLDETMLLGDIPDSFTNTPAEKYPLVLTFHKFLMMLDASIGVSYFSRFCSIEELSVNSFSLRSLLRPKEVNFERFCSLYWPHFNNVLTKSLDASRVFTEIMSYIKGSSNGAGDECILSREDYVLLSDKRTSTLSSKTREDIYDIFQGYERTKLRNREYDVADIVIDLHHRLAKDRLQTPKLDFVYIDEVQDLTMSQISLFKHVCSNVDEGFVFFGDTAQTIARGIDFRFEDIRSLFYNEFLMGSRREPATRTNKGYISDTFNLTRNFRTHTGVLMLAQSVINLLYHFFPQSIDILKPETSLIFGEPPVFIEPCSDENAILSIFGDVKGSGSAMIGFGAEQVILVRDDYAKEEVCGCIGNKALVLTILECKGLEFQDVLLYNFFGSSPLRHQWRVVYELMKQENLLDSTFEKSYPSFNYARHSLMCSELKQLYIAITRTRQRLWISENTEDFSMPILDYWKKLGLVQLRVVDSSLVKAMQVASTVQEWQTRAVKLLWEENYEMAMLCFERAGDELGGKMAKAAALKARARRLHDSKQDEMQLILREAGELYNSIGKADLAAECYIDIGDFERAGKIYFEKGGKYDLKKAGDCFMSAHCYQLAAESYAESHYIAECLSACVQGQLFDKGLCYIDSWKGNTTLNNENVNWNTDLAEIAQKFLEDCATKYHMLKNIQSMMKFVRAFDTIAYKRSFLRSVGCLHELLQLEDESGNFMEAAEIADELGDILLKADFLLKAGRCKDSCFLILWHVVVNSLWNSGGGGWPLKQFPQKEDLLLKSRSIAAQEGDIFSGLVCTDVGLLSHEDHKLSTLGQYLVHLSNTSVKEVNLYPLERFLTPISGPVPQIISGKTSFQAIWIIVKFHKCIQDLSSQNFDDKDSVEFCLNYFGVRRRMNSEITEYQILVPDAQWVKKMNVSGSVRECGKFSSIDESALVLDVKGYWEAELINISLKVLDALQVLFNSFSVNSSFSVFRQSMCLLYIHKVMRFLQGWNLFKCKTSDSKKFEKFRLLSHAFLYKVFTLDSRLSLTRSMVYLRKNQDSQDLLSEIIHEVFKLHSSLTYGQVGKVMMICLGSGEITDELHQEISEKFAGNAAWKDLFEACSDTRKLESQLENMQIGNSLGSDDFPVNRKLHSRRSQEDLPRERRKDSNGFSLIRKFHRTLEDTYHKNWKEIEDYIFPNCFIYLVDRLVFLSSCSQEVFFTTRSSLTESIMHKKLVNYRCMEDSLRAFDFVVMIFRQLVSCREDFVEWVRRSNINPSNYIPLLFQKLVVLVTLICLNSGRYSDLLKEIFYDRNIRLPLSLELYKLHKLAMVGHGFLDPSVVAQALELIEDPLVIVSFNGSSLNVEAPAAIIIGMDDLQSDDIVDLLFPKEFTSKPMGSGETSAPAGRETSCEKSTGIVFDWVSFQEMHTYLRADANMEKLKCLLSVFKEKMEGSITCLTAAMALSVHNPSHGGINYTDEMNNLLEDLNQLSSALESGNEEHEGNVVEIRQLIERVLSRRPVLEDFINHVFYVEEKIFDNKSGANVQCSKQGGVYRDAENWNALPQDDNSKKQAQGKEMKGKGNRKGKGKSKGRKGSREFNL